MENPLVLGVDIGGSHITAGLIDLEKRKLISSSIRHKSVNPHENADAIFNSWCQVIEAVYTGRNIAGKRIGLAIPGPFDYKNGICLIKEQDKFKSLYLMNVKNELARRLKMKPANIKFVNDAEAFLKGEIFATPSGHDSVLGITLGTGLGSALYLKGEVRDADLWNSPFQEGIAEEYLAAGWLINRYFQLTGLKVTGVKEISEVVTRDPIAKQVFVEFGNNLAQFLHSQVERHSLGMILIGGNISYAFDHFSEGLSDGLAQTNTRVTIRVSELKENAALIGAAAEEFDKELKD
jgi:glucokinase